MAAESDMVDGPLATDPAFAETQWSIIRAARGDSDRAASALEQLCRRYWYPLYAFVRRRGHTAEDAQDLTQGFFARLLEKDWLDQVDPSKGKFRSFLLASMKHFLANARDHAQAVKRGGGRTTLSLDADTAESRYANEPFDSLTPERIYDRRWALTLLEQVMASLREEYVLGGKQSLFEHLKPVLVAQAAPYAEIGRDLKMSEGAVKVAAHRLRQRYREILRTQVAQTVASPEELEEELRDLLKALGA
jgi:RNA polymerase sigma-70 factor (ECF subfamily)